MDNLGMCRFHRQWAEEMLPEIVGSMWAKKDEYLQCISQTASRISSRNASVFWESERNIDFVHTYMKRRHEIENDNDKELLSWLERFDSDKHAAAFDYWFEVLKGIHESLHEF
jgi:glyceraldehyde-3-phosphate dehydrogenase (ferredoxin)